MRRASKAGCSLLAALTLAACGAETPDTPSLLTGQQQRAVEPSLSFEPVLQWEWSGSTVKPQHRQVMMTPVVVDVSGDGIPDVVFNAFESNISSENGILRAVNGADGKDLWAVTDPAFEVRGTAHIAAGDIDFDGKVELCTIPESGQGIICFEHDGTFKFRNSAGTNEWGGPSLADLDGDGNVEILNGAYVYSHTGALKWGDAGGGKGSGARGPISFGADIDGDGLQEVINDRTLYRHDGTTKCTNTQLSAGGLAGVGNFDADLAGEIVLVEAGKVSLMDDTCNLLWSASVPGGGGGAPNIANFDSDPEPEIGVAGASRYAVFEADGTVKWSSATQDRGSQVTGSTTFDFEGDGTTEVAYADETTLRIYDGATGAVRFSMPNSSGTTYEFPIVVDVDGDDSAELVVVSNNFGGRSGTAGIRVFRDRNDGWVSTRRIWNQHAYSVTHVNEDGTIPPHPLTNWRVRGLNTFRSNTQGPPPPFVAPDLSIVDVSVTCGPQAGQATLVATVLNQGDAATSPNVPVALYEGDPSAGGVLLGVARLTEVLPAGQSSPAKLTMAPLQRTVAIHAVADSDGAGGSQETERREDNNRLSVTVDFRCPPGDNQRPVALCQAVTVPAHPLTCQATASVNNGSYDPDNGPQPLSVSEAPAGPFGPGSHDITLEASDGASSAVCTAAVTVVDVTPPTLTLVGDPSPVIECGYALPPGVVASDACSGDLTSRIEVLNFTNNVPGFYEVLHRVRDDAGNITEGARRWVNVEDDTAPTLELMGAESMEMECGIDSYVDPGATAYDACSGVLPVSKFNSGDDDGDGIPGSEDPDDHGPGPHGNAEGTYPVQYLAIDAAGNSVQRTRTVRTRDTRPPVLTLNGPVNVTIPYGKTFEDPWASASDLCYGELTAAIVRKGSVNSHIPGTYELTYTVEDGAGLSAPPVYRKVTVSPSLAPETESAHLRTEAGSRALTASPSRQSP